MAKKNTQAQKRFRNLAELNRRLEWRGAADENLSSWCRNIVKLTKSAKKASKGKTYESLEDILQMGLGDVHFPCSQIKTNLEVPLETPLSKDPAVVKDWKPKRNISSGTILDAPRHYGTEKYSLWTKNFSKLYPVFKIPSHQFPI